MGRGIVEAADEIGAAGGGRFEQRRKSPPEMIPTGPEWQMHDAIRPEQGQRKLIVLQTGEIKENCRVAHGERVFGQRARAGPARGHGPGNIQHHHDLGVGQFLVLAEHELAGFSQHAPVQVLQAVPRVILAMLAEVRRKSFQGRPVAPLQQTLDADAGKQLQFPDPVRETAAEQVGRFIGSGDHS